MAATPFYTYRTLYSIPFTGNVEDGGMEDYRIDLLKRVSQSTIVPDVVVLDGGPSPFISSLADDSDPLTTIRTSTAQISFVDDVDIGEFLPIDGFEWQVNLIRERDNEALFVGFLTGEVYSQPYIDGGNVVTVNAVSPAVPALASTMAIADIPALTIGELFAGLLRQSKLATQLYVPAIFTREPYMPIEGYTDILRFRFSTANFKSIANNKDASIEQWNVQTYAEAVDAVCKLFAWSLVDSGDGALYLVAPAHKGRYMVLSAEELESTGQFTPATIYPITFDKVSIEAVDGADRVEYRQGCGSAIVEAQPVDAKLDFADISSQIKSWEYIRTRTTADHVSRFELQGRYLAEVGKKVATLAAGRIVLPRYRSVGSGGDRSWVEVTDGSVDKSRDIQLSYIESDSAPPSAIEGAAPQKRNWSFKGFYRLPRLLRVDNVPHFFSTAEVERRPILKTILPLGLARGGAINIYFTIRASYMDGFYMPSDLDFKGGNATASVVGNLVDPSLPPGTDGNHTEDIFCGWFFGIKKKVHVSLRLGELWWNGSAWTSVECDFPIEINRAEAEWHDFPTNKTVDMPWLGESGLFIPLPGYSNGDVEFWLMSDLCAFTLPEGNDTGVYVSWGLNGNIFADVSDLSISYCPEIKHAGTSVNVAASRRKDFGRAFKEEKTISLRLHGDINGSYQQSLVYIDNNEVLDAIYANQVLCKPEDYLLSECERIYARIQRRWNRGMYLRHLTPVDLFGGESTGESLMITGMSVDYAAGTQRVYLSEVRNK